MRASRGAALAAPLAACAALVLYTALVVQVARSVPSREALVLDTWQRAGDDAAAATAAWREAEYEAQGAARRVALLQSQLRAKSVLASEKRRAGYPSPLSADQLRAQLRDAERDAASLARAAAALRPPAQPGHEHERPLLTQLPRSRVRHVNVSFILQYFRKPHNIVPITQRLYACTRGRLGADLRNDAASAALPEGLTSELIAHVDSRGDAAAWEAAMGATSAGRFVSLIWDDDLHEVHGYNRGAALATGDVLVMLQDDDLPPDDCSWLATHLDSFARYPRLGSITHRGGYFWFPEELGDKEHMRAPDLDGPLFEDPVSNQPFEFISTLAYGPVAFRAEAWRDAGGMDVGMTPERGDCGIYADAEFALRLWARGWQVAHSDPVFERGPAEGGSSHSGAARHACYSKQRHLNYWATARRFPMSFTRQVLRRVIALNGQLRRRFDGPAPWEHPRWQGGLGMGPGDALPAQDAG